jgi:hypothetical protein
LLAILSLIACKQASYNDQLMAGLFEQTAAPFELLIARVRRIG